MRGIEAKLLFDHGNQHEDGYGTSAPPVTLLPNDASKWVDTIRERINESDTMAREGNSVR